MSQPATPAAHSERYFTDARDHWWHADYLALLARRFRVGEARTFLEVGVGQGHFTRAWAPHFAPGFAVTGVDREERSVAIARERTAVFQKEHSLQGTFDFVVGEAERLPFPDDTFDMVFCQTLLIHLRDPAAGFAEMVRVARPGGLILAVEPNNLASFQRLASAGPDADVDEQLAAARFHLRVLRGKYALGLGWNNQGIHLPRLLRGLDEVAFYNNDRAWVVAPPYESAQERSSLADLARDVAEGVYGWPRSEARDYYLAGGGTDGDFEVDYDGMLARQREELRQCEKGEWSELVAFAGLIAGGRKPR